MRFFRVIINIFVSMVLFVGMGYAFHFFVFADTGVYAEDDVKIQTEAPINTVDTDGDGLVDEIEIEYGTDPIKVDTDGDGYTDGLEVLAGYNPFGPGKLKDAILPESANKDFDDDGIFNILETLTSTNYKKADTDGDGLTDKYEINWGFDPLNKDTDDDGYEDGAELVHGYNPTGSGYLPGLQPVEISQQNTPSPEVNPNQNPANPTPQAPTTPLSMTNKDTDGDGLLDSDEIILGTDPMKKDTDGDGVSDYDELINKTNPLKK
jgi:hypothetical protein